MLGLRIATLKPLRVESPGSLFTELWIARWIACGKHGIKPVGEHDMFLLHFNDHVRLQKPT